jgi:hypothetical protein
MNMKAAGPQEGARLACRPGLQTVINYALQQSLIPRKIDVEELFDATTRAL